MVVSQGMNHPAVLIIASQLDTDQQQVSDLMARTSSAVTTLGANWFGNDASQFASEWATQSTSLRLAADVLAAMSRQARAQASDQQATSS